MTKKKLLDDIKENPARIYRAPADVLRDRRFGDSERLEILRAWRTRNGAPGLDALIAEVEGRFTANGHAAE
ncbi:MAG TPA: hypothetical protein VFQ69_06395 [Rhizomicrobium sp.]|nr:hypothetical protein [Rhizomicrobium sp.]